MNPSIWVVCIIGYIPAGAIWKDFGIFPSMPYITPFSVATARLGCCKGGKCSEIDETITLGRFSAMQRKVDTWIGSAAEAGWWNSCDLYFSISGTAVAIKGTRRHSGGFVW